MTSHADTALIELASKGSSDPSWDEADVDVSSYLGATGVGIIVAGLAARRASMSGGATVMSSDSIVGNGKCAPLKACRQCHPQLSVLVWTPICTGLRALCADVADM